MERLWSRSPLLGLNLAKAGKSAVNTPFTPRGKLRNAHIVNYWLAPPAEKAEPDRQDVRGQARKANSNAPTRHHQFQGKMNLICRLFSGDLIFTRTAMVSVSPLKVINYTSRRNITLSKCRNSVSIIMFAVCRSVKN